MLEGMLEKLAAKLAANLTQKLDDLAGYEITITVNLKKEEPE